MIDIIYFFLDHPVQSILLGGDVLATIAVGWGILWEAPDQSPERHRIAKWLVIGGIIAETVFSISLFVYDESISQEQQSKIIALETKLAPRTLSETQIAEITEALKPFSGEKYVGSVGAGIADGCSLWGQLDQALSNAGWDRVRRIFTFCEPGAESPVYPLVGITIFVEDKRDDKTFRASDALVRALKGKLAARTEVIQYNANTTTQNAPDVLTIEIGIKPP